MSDDSRRRTTMEALKAIEAEQRARYAPKLTKPPEPRPRTTRRRSTRRATRRSSPSTRAGSLPMTPKTKTRLSDQLAEHGRAIATANQRARAVELETQHRARRRRTLEGRAHRRDRRR